MSRSKSISFRCYKESLGEHIYCVATCCETITGKAGWNRTFYALEIGIIKDGKIIPDVSEILYLTLY